MRSALGPSSPIGLFLAVATLAGCGSSLSLPTSEAVRACETATACGIAKTIDSCVDDYSSLARRLAASGTATFGPDQLACLAHAGSDCDAAQRCLNLGAPVASCTNEPGRCDGDQLHQCAFGSTYAFDCASVGLHCVVGTMGFAACGIGACTTEGSSCDYDGASLLECTEGVLLRGNCTQDGLTCVEGRPFAMCVGTGPACNSAPSCDGDVVVSCDFGRQSRVDCAARGLHCTVDSHGFAACANGTACDSSFKASCDGAGKITYCYLGALVTADCRADGFSGCAAAACVR